MYLNVVITNPKILKQQTDAELAAKAKETAFEIGVEAEAEAGAGAITFYP